MSMSTEDMLTIFQALKTKESFTTPEDMPRINSAIYEVQKLLGWGDCRDCGKNMWMLRNLNSRYCASCGKTHGI